jgi:CRP/FNR family transcriptional regulator
MLGALSRYMHHLVAVVEELSLKEVPARLARFLLDNAGPPGTTPGPREYRLATTKGDLALRLGTTSETFSRVFGRMKKLGIVSEKNRRILLHMEDVLRDMVHGMKL